MVAILNLLLWDGVLISLNNFLFFEIVDVKLFWKVKKGKFDDFLCIHSSYAFNCQKRKLDS